MTKSKISTCPSPSADEKQRLRRSLKSKRQTLSKANQTEARSGIARQARAFRQLFSSRRILSYSPIRGEIDPGALLMTLNAEIYLPKITNYRNRSMQFVKGGSISSANMLGIAEPALTSTRLPAKYFDAVLVPLVAFDRNGNRLGMGAGYYDRSFAFKLWQGYCKRPLLIGLAHHFQEVNSLIADSWDVRLDAIITDRELIII